MDTSLYFPVPTFRIVQDKNPQIIPCVIEYENGIKIIAKKAGMASSNFDQLIFLPLSVSPQTTPIYRLWRHRQWQNSKKSEYIKHRITKIVNAPKTKSQPQINQ